jgi:signal peptidase
VDADGNLFVVNFQKRGTIGKVSPGGDHSELFAELPDGSIGSGIRFDRDGRMYVADFKKHKILVFEPRTTVPLVYAKEHFHQPNDLAIAADGTLYASDRARRVWRITRGSDGKGHGVVMSSDRTMGITNGIDLSPDGKTLYVSESDTQEVHAYRIEGNELTNSKLVKKFPHLPGGDLDGLRTDVDGKIFVSRQAEGKVVVLTPDGNLVREIGLRGRDPTNPTFGGPDGKTVFVTQSDGGFIETFRVERPGREPCLQAPATCPANP